MKDNDFFVNFLIVVFVATLCSFMASASGELKGRRDVQKEAISAGVAHYEADKDGNVKFLWNQK